MSIEVRKRTLHWPITLSVSLMAANITLMVCWIVLLARLNSWTTMTIGIVVFALMLVGLVFYLILTIKETRLNRRQANFVDSVTHELKSPIASLRLYLETLQMRAMDEDRRTEFYQVMETELKRLDHLISQVLEIGRLDAVGQRAEPEDVRLEGLLDECAETACNYHQRSKDEIVTFATEPVTVRARRLVLEMIFNNLLDNAVKYAGEPPEVHVEVRRKDRKRVLVRIADNGEGVPAAIRKKIFRIFYRGGDELERKQKGTGLGLYIAYTLARLLKGTISVDDRQDGPGAVFEVELPGRAEGCES